MKSITWCKTTSNRAQHNAKIIFPMLWDKLHEKRHSRILTSFGVWSSFILCPSNKNRSELRATPCHKVYVVYIYFWWRKCFSEKAIKCVWSKRLQSFKRMLFNFSYLTYLSITESLL
jgi:hypothetical protein